MVLEMEEIQNQNREIIQQKKNMEAKLNILLKATNGLEFAHIDPTCYSILSRN